MPNRIRLALIAGIIAVTPLIAASQNAEHIGSYTWRGMSEKHGGFSGIEVSDDGMRFTVIGDKGAIVEGRFIRVNGQISAVQSSIHKLKNTTGRSVSKIDSDAEGLAITASGRIFISFEHHHRVWGYQDSKAKAAWLPQHPDFKHLKSNDGLEALAIDPDGTLFALPEKSSKESIHIYRYKGDKWDQPFSIPRIKHFKAVGADFGPDGKFYLLERTLKSIFGFKTRIRRFEIQGDTIGAGEVVLETASGLHDNLEGLSVWRDDAGDIRLTMIADDNFNWYQRSEFVEYRLQE
ncbi:esterase-like activity of phytase family protein [Profundibacter sp.]